MSVFVQILLVLWGAVSRAQSEKETLKRDQNRKPAAQKIHFSSFANPSALKKINGFSFCHLSILSLFLLFFLLSGLKVFYLDHANVKNEIILRPFYYGLNFPKSICDDKSDDNDNDDNDNDDGADDAKEEEEVVRPVWERDG